MNGFVKLLFYKDTSNKGMTPEYLYRIYEGEIGFKGIDSHNFARVIYAGVDGDEDNYLYAGNVRSLFQSG